MTAAQFQDLMTPIFAYLSDKPVDATLTEALNSQFPVGGDTLGAIRAACDAAVEAGWMCSNGPDNMRFGRVLKATEDTHDFSVDVVSMTDVVGPHHAHPNGEICLVMPVDETAKFDGRGAGWCVYPPGSAHNPTVTDGHALVLYMLPGGAITFTR